MDNHSNSFLITDKLIQSLTKHTFSTNEEFVEAFEAALTNACEKISRSVRKHSKLYNIEKVYNIIQGISDSNNRKIMEDFVTKSLEDDISMRIMDIITEDSRFYSTIHDGYHNGHVDIYASYKNPSTKKVFVWLGEAKIYNGPEYVKGGLKQLINDYSTGNKNENGGILIYLTPKHKELTIKKVTEIWEDTLKQIATESDDIKLDNIYFEENKDLQGSFITIHNHHKSGYEYRINHIIIELRP